MNRDRRHDDIIHSPSAATTARKHCEINDARNQDRV